MSSAQPISLATYTDILIAHENKYRLSRGETRQGVVGQIIEDIASRGKGKFKEGNTKGLELVSQPFYH